MQAFKRALGTAIAVIICVPLALVLIAALVVAWPIVVALGLSLLGALMLFDGNRPAL